MIRKSFASLTFASSVFKSPITINYLSIKRFTGSLIKNSKLFLTNYFDFSSIAATINKYCNGVGTSSIGNCFSA